MNEIIDASQLIFKMMSDYWQATVKELRDEVKDLTIYKTSYEEIHSGIYYDDARARLICFGIKFIHYSYLSICSKRE